ncbi:adenosylcobinamide-GDP ribazoletransferase [Chloroflexota bacterium]
MKFVAALQFLTSIRLPWLREARPEEFGRSVVYFPVVGLIIGLILAGLNWLLSLILPSALVNASLLVSLVVITGALHLDGFADTCDGIAGHRTAEDRHQVMHDSRVGGFGVVGVVLLLLVKYVALSSIPESLMMTTLLFMPVVSRWTIVYALFAYPYARPSGLGLAFKQGARWHRFTAATLITFAVSVFLIPLFHLAGFIIIFAVWVITVITAAYLKGKFSGLSGDTYGAINELVEVSVLILVIILARLGLA